jgi:hypothetical protein
MILQDSTGELYGGNVHDGNGGLAVYGPVKPGSSWLQNSDFAEYFEWADGNPNAEDRVGYMVQMNGAKIEKATEFANCIGIISSTSSFIGNACTFEWNKKYLTDEWSRLIYEEVDGKMVPKINPEYDPTLEYIPREKRPEWSIVGLVGQVLTRQDGSLKVGGFAGCKDGIATASTTGYRVLRIVNENVALLLVK